MKERRSIAGNKIDWRGTLAVMGLWALLCGGAIQYQAQQGARAAGSQRRLVASRLGSRAPAPKVRKGKPVVVKGRKMSSWVVTGAGDGSYNGTYVESGAYDGHPAYTNGSRWLYWADADYWALSDTPHPGPMGEAYYGGATLPGSWSAEEGDTPAPSVSAFSTGITSAWAASYLTVPWLDAPFLPRPGNCAPARASVDSAEYVCFPLHDATAGRYGIVTYATGAGDWGWAPAPAALHSSWDDYHTAGAWDAGEGSLYVSSGVYLDGTAWKLDFGTHTIVPGNATTQSALDSLTLDGGDISNFCQVSGGDFLCMVISGTSARLCSYGVGNGSLKVERSWASVPPLPASYSAVQLGALSRHDHYLYREPSTGALYWLRHCVSGSQHRIVAYQIAGTRTTTPPTLYGNSEWALVGDQLVGESLTQLDALLAVGNNTDTCQTWGAYHHPAGTLVCDVGTRAELASTIRWAPRGCLGTASQGGGTGSGLADGPRAPFVSYPAGRRWYLDGEPLLLAGWTDGSYSYLPFVVYATPATAAAAGSASDTSAGDCRLAEALPLQSAPAGMAAGDVSARGVALVGGETASLYAAAHEVSVIGTAGRTPAPSTSEWRYVRVRAG